MSSEKHVTRILETIKIIDKGINLERNAQLFYKKASEMVDSVEGKKTFRWLADFESSHEARLRSRRTDMEHSPYLAEIQVPDVREDPDISEAAVIEEFDPNITDVNIIIIAIENEERIRAFYEKKLAHVDDQDSRKILELLMKEEEKHKRILQDQMQHLELNRRWGNLESIVRNDS